MWSVCLLRSHRRTFLFQLISIRTLPSLYIMGNINYVSVNYTTRNSVVKARNISHCEVKFEAGMENHIQVFLYFVISANGCDPLYVNAGRILP